MPGGENSGLKTCDLPPHPALTTYVIAGVSGSGKRWVCMRPMRKNASGLAARLQHACLPAAALFQCLPGAWYIARQNQMHKSPLLTATQSVPGAMVACVPVQYCRAGACRPFGQRFL